MIRTLRIGGVRSLGFRTDLMLRRMAGSSIVEHTGYLVVRTPANPGFWWGDFVLFADPPTRTDALAVFAAEFPGAAHVAIGVDRTDGILGDGLVDLGLTVEVNSVLTAQHLRAPSPGPDVESLLRSHGEFPCAGDREALAFCRAVAAEMVRATAFPAPRR